MSGVDHDTWVAEAGELAGDPAEVARWADRLPPGYRDRTTPAEFVSDLHAVGRLASAGGPGGTFGRHYDLRLRLAEPGDAATLRLRRTGLEPVELTEVLPVLESFGMAVTEAVPQHVTATPDQPEVHFDDFGLRPAGELAGGPLLDVDADSARMVDALRAAADGAVDVDDLNALVVRAGLDWRQVVLLRALRRFRRQAGAPAPDVELDAALLAWPTVAAAIVGLVEARLAGPAPADDPTRLAAVHAARAAVLDALGPVTELSADSALRGFLAVADATVRTNWYAPDRPDTIVLKLDSGRVAELPRPRPHVEAFVHGPLVEGVHLRMGPVARGGIRHSDRPSDFRTEVLALAEAQTKKNAIIVPTGAKGGFVVRRGQGPDAVLAAYRRFITGLLEITDDVVDASVRHPEGVAAADGDDPYLVVAADKGTATFSDDANALSEGRGFWLGDAFASGGSHGYDHKAMGITARGAWVAVRRHFRQLGVDVQRETIRVVGVGDMSGDVFGNGMLRSEAIALVAAFDHRHVFIDPDPDPAVAYAARKALAARGRSSWADYDPHAISPGGGVWSRTARSIPLSPQARAVLGVTDDELAPPAVVSAILAAPVDLLFFGGIGTFVRDVGEADAEVGDHANDAVRITADQLRARVVAEGGNLGISPRARVRYSRRGGRVNADFIDNAAGVATSDREVNLKILLGVAEAAGRLGPGDRDRLLAEATDEVATEVLRQVDHTVAALDRSVPDSAAAFDAYVALLRHLESVGLVDRVVEALPDDDTLVTRRQAGGGFARPELATLLAFAKIDLVRSLLAADVLGDPLFEAAVTPYFPTGMRAVAGDLVTRHRLYRQLAATDVAGDLVDVVGPTWAHETAAELGRDLADAAAAWWAARTVTGAGPAFSAIEAAAAAGDLDADEEAALHARCVAAVTRLARRYLRDGAVRPSDVVARDGAAGAPSQSSTTVHLVEAVEAAAHAAGMLAPLAAEAGCSPAEAAAALAAVDATPVVAACTALVGAGGGGRFGAWQARVLVDDIDDLRAEVARAALATSDAAAAVAQWSADPTAPAARAAAVLAAAGVDPARSAAALADAARSLGPSAATVAALAVRAAQGRR